MKQDDVTELCLASSTRPRRRNLLAAVAQYIVSHFRSSSTKSSSWFLSSLMKTENLPFLESVARQFSSLPIFVDCNKVRKHFEYILYAWMEAFQVCKCKSTADRTCDFTPLSARRSFELFAINVK